MLPPGHQCPPDPVTLLQSGSGLHFAYFSSCICWSQGTSLARFVQPFEAMLLFNQPDPFLLLPHCVSLIQQLLSCPHSLLSPLLLAEVDTSLHCFLLRSTPSGAYCCLPPAVCPTAPPICQPGAMLPPPAHGPAPLSQLRAQMSSCSLVPCCHQYPPLPHSASSLPAYCCCHCPVARCLLLPGVVPVTVAACCHLQ